MRYLAIDLGDKRTGLAIGDDVTQLVTPLSVLEIGINAGLSDRLQHAINEQQPDAIVFGLPLNMDGTEGPKAKQTREFGKQLADFLDIPVYYQDERLTSYAADQAMAQSGQTHKQKKKQRDAIAAAEILRDFLHDKSRATS